MKILIVEDTPLNIDVLVDYLQKDYELLIAINGFEALEILKDETPDLILMDIIMPEMNGFETTQKIIDDPSIITPPIIFLTADNDKENLSKSFEVGGVDFIHKPIIYSELRARIKTHLELSNYKKNLEKIIEKQTKEIENKNKILLDKLYLDENTGLKNMLSLQKDLKFHKNGSLLLFDIDNFNTINKLYGFNFGDTVLKSVAQVLSELLEEISTVYKIGSDRFVIVSDTYIKNDIQRICEMIFHYFDNNFISIENNEIKISFSIGISQIKGNGESMVEAEYSLDLAKKMGRRFRFFYEDDSYFIKIEKDNLLWLSRTREYIEKNMIEPFYQPIVEVKTKRIYKYEALARVIDNGETIHPQKFLTAAKRLGLLTHITKMMIEKACKNFENTQTKFSLNITQRDLIEDYLHIFIKEQCDLNNIDPHNITIELLENVTLTSENEDIINSLIKIKDLGCKVAIDDFGSENSNFSRIISLKSDYLKVDGMFIENIDQDIEKQKIISAIVGLAKKLNIKTIAEYVTDEEVFNMLEKLDIDYVQGFYFGKPEQYIN